MNILKHRMANTGHVLALQRGGTRVNPNDYRVGESLVASQDVDLSVDEQIVSVAKNTPARVVENDGINVTVDFGTTLGKFAVPRSEIGKYFSRTKMESEGRRGSGLSEANPTAVAPGRLVQITRYDPTIGPNRGPHSPGHGGYQTLVGQRGTLVTVFGVINGIKTYKVQLVHGGEFVFGETEFSVLESSDKKRRPELNERALAQLGYGTV